MVVERSDLLDVFQLSFLLSYHLLVTCTSIHLQPEKILKVSFVQWLRLLTLNSVDAVQFPAKAAVFFHYLLKQELITLLYVHPPACKIPDASWVSLD